MNIFSVKVKIQKLDTDLKAAGMT